MTAGRREATLVDHGRTAVFVVLGLMVLTIGALVMLVVAVPTLFRARRLYSEVFAKRLGQAILRLGGVRMVVHQAGPLPTTQTIYISNHTSAVDVFILIALGLPRTRYFMAGWLRAVLPLGLIGYLIRIFWIARQHEPACRVEIFRRADRVLRRTGDSVYLSPEGMRVLTGEIGHFNKGAFHLATSLGAPIVPMYFHIPPEVDPCTGAWEIRPGTVNVYVLPTISTTGWRLEDLERNREAVRQQFVRVHANLRSGRADPSVPSPRPSVLAGP